MFLPSIVADRPDLIGVSITATSQIIPGLTLCRLIKEAAPDLHRDDRRQHLYATGG